MGADLFNGTRILEDSMKGIRLNGFNAY
jgi:hypothetical protein